MCRPAGAIHHQKTQQKPQMLLPPSHRHSQPSSIRMAPARVVACSRPVGHAAGHIGHQGAGNADDADQADHVSFSS
jgi:hypothetical protein